MTDSKVLNILQELSTNSLGLFNGLNEWETTFINDMLNRYEKYGENLRVSPKQADWVVKIYDKLQWLTERERRRFAPFREELARLLQDDLLGMSADKLLREIYLRKRLDPHTWKDVVALLPQSVRGDYYSVLNSRISAASAINSLRTILKELRNQGVGE